MMPDQNGRTGRITTRSWAFLNSAAFGLAFLSFIPGMFVIDFFLPAGLTNMGASSMPEVLVPDALPAWLDRQTYESWYRMHLGYHVVALAGFGGIVGWFQSRLLREHIPALEWIVATALGFVAILCVEVLEPHAVVGPHAGPTEPLLISIGGSTLAGLAQWLVLRRQGVPGSRWLTFWFLGVLVGVSAAICGVISLDQAIASLFEPQTIAGPMAQGVGWAVWLLTFGLFTGAGAGALSARALNSALRGRAA